MNAPPIDRVRLSLSFLGYYSNFDLSSPLAFFDVSPLSAASASSGEEFASTIADEVCGL